MISNACRFLYYYLVSSSSQSGVSFGQHALHTDEESSLHFKFCITKMSIYYFNDNIKFSIQYIEEIKQPKNRIQVLAKIKYLERQIRILWAEQ